MPTTGLRPPPDQHNPMAFDPRIGRTVVVVDRAGAAEVWLYDLGRDAWQAVPTAVLPFACGMNYNLEYDPHHQVLLLVTGDYKRPTAVWALRGDLSALPPSETPCPAPRDRPGSGGKSANRLDTPEPRRRTGPPGREPPGR